MKERDLEFKVCPQYVGGTVKFYVKERKGIFGAFMTVNGLLFETADEAVHWAEHQVVLRSEAKVYVSDEE